MAPVGSAVIKMRDREKGLLVVARMFTRRTLELWAFLEAKTAKGAGLRRVYEHDMPEDEACAQRKREIA